MEKCVLGGLQRNNWFCLDESSDIRQEILELVENMLFNIFMLNTDTTTPMRMDTL